MRLRTGPVLLAVIAFVAVLLWRLPLRWALPLLPEGVTCSAPAGSLWRGRCGDLVLAGRGGNLPVGPVTWQLQAGALLRGRVAGTAQVNGPLLQGETRFSAGARHTLELADLQGSAPLDRRLLPMLPANWTGTLTLRIAELRLISGRLERVQGEAELRDIVAQGPRPDEFGSYALRIPAAAPGQPHRGELRDIGGPLELSGTLVMQPDLTWQLDALVTPRASASPSLARAIEFLGPADAAGRRRISAAGDFN